MKKILFTKDTYKVHESASWAEYNIHSYEWMNDPWGKIYYIQAWIHGTEIVGTPVIYEIMDWIKEYNAKINIICVPIANPFGMDSQIMWQQTGYANIHTNQQNAHNYNKIWKLSGWEFENSIIKTLIWISEKADTWIDLHSAWAESEEHIYYNPKTENNVEKFGIDNIIRIDWEPEEWCFDDIARRHWRESYTLELWASHKIEPYRIEKYKEKILWF